MAIFSPDFTVNGQIWLFYDEKWIFVKSLGTFAEDNRLINTDTSFFVPGKKKPLHFLLIQPPYNTDTFVSFQSFLKQDNR